jgi:DNA mismatch repair ATPase MutS
MHGTNSQDRRIGAAAVIRKLIDGGAIGMVTTHDLALSEIADALGKRAENAHFEYAMEDGRMVFDYTMREGVVAQTNALEVMRSLGLDV